MRFTERQYEDMLENVVNELDLSECAVDKYGPLGVEPAVLVRAVLDEKDLIISALKHKMKLIQ